MTLEKVDQRRVHFFNGPGIVKEEVHFHVIFLIVGDEMMNSTIIDLYLYVHIFVEFHVKLS